jgi:protein TonB
MTLIQYDATYDAAQPGLASRAMAFVVPIALATVTTIGLLWVMQSLIIGQEANLDEAKSMNLVDFVRTPESQEVEVKQRQPKKPPPPEEPPPEIDKVDFSVAVESSEWGMSPVLDADAGNMSNSFSFVSDGSQLPIVKVQPAYPQTALIHGQEGWVVLQFSIDEIGRVVDPIVLENCAHVSAPGKSEECWDHPNRVFDSAALRAVKKFKYKPKIEDGVAVAVHNVRHKITFELMDE